jgi:hypothetical protein
VDNVPNQNPKNNPQNEKNGFVNAVENGGIIEVDQADQTVNKNKKRRNTQQNNQ